MPSPPSRALFLRNARQLLTLAGPPIPRRGREMRELGIIENGAVLTEDARILRVGKTRDLKAEARRRALSHEFFGHIAYFSLIGRRVEA